MGFYENVTLVSLTLIVVGVCLGLISAKINESFVNERPKDAAKQVAKEENE